jgi:hypothetical protein
MIIYARTPPGFAGLSEAEKARPGRAFDQTLKKYAGKVDLIRRYWTSAFTHESSDIFIMECDDPMVAHAFQEDLAKAFARIGGDPARFGATVHASFGINPDADRPKKRR